LGGQKNEALILIRFDPDRNYPLMSNNIGIDFNVIGHTNDKKLGLRRPPKKRCIWINKFLFEFDISYAMIVGFLQVIKKRAIPQSHANLLFAAPLKIRILIPV
jgi:hypothetical protein